MNETRDGELLRRFEAVSGDFQQTRDNVLKLQQGYTTLSSEVVDLRRSIEGLNTVFQQKLEAISTRLQESAKPNWPLLVGLVPVMVAAMAFFISTYTTQATVRADIAELQTGRSNLITDVRAISTSQAQLERDSIGLGQQSTANNSSIATMKAQIEKLQQASVEAITADASALADRNQSGARLHEVERQLEDEVAQRREQTSSFRTALGEIETQFKAVSDVANLRGAQQERINSLLWAKAYGEHYPDLTFFPPSTFSPGSGTE